MKTIGSAIGIKDLHQMIHGIIGGTANEIGKETGTVNETGSVIEIEIVTTTATEIETEIEIEIEIGIEKGKEKGTETGNATMTETEIVTVNANATIVRDMQDLLLLLDVWHHLQLQHPTHLLSIWQRATNKCPLVPRPWLLGRVYLLMDSVSKEQLVARTRLVVVRMMGVGLGRRIGTLAVGLMTDG